MIGQAAWFTKRKYTGWGLTPKTWQGWVYIAGAALGAYLISQLPFDESGRMLAVSGWVVLVVADILHTMSQLKLDERETKIEAISERNASWTMVGALALSAGYLVTLGSQNCGQDVAPVVIIPMVAGLVVKSVSNFVLQNREI